jgi:peroxiredoxin
MRAAFLAILAFLLALAGAIAWFALVTPRRPVQIGQPAPPVALDGEDGRHHDLRDYSGRAVALVFVPDLGETTRAQLRSLNASMPQFDAIGVKVFAISPAPRSAAAEIHRDEKLTFPILLDAEGRIARSYRVPPRTDAPPRASFVIGPDGRVLLPLYDVDAARHGEPFALPRVDTGAQEPAFSTPPSRATVILFLSARCPCSGGYDARVAALERDYGRRGVRIVAIYANAGEAPKEIEQHARKAGFRFPVLRDEGAIIADRLGAKVTPEVYVTDSLRVLRYHGRIDDNRDAQAVKENSLRNAIDVLLAGKLPNPPETQAFGCAIARSAP